MLRKAATDRRLRPMARDEIQIYYHAALTAYVAAWDAYINNLVRNFYDVIADPSDPKFRAIYTIARQRAENALTRFNTPNSENTRNIFLWYTGYDPINTLLWIQRGKLDDIIEVRHSFAHGFDIQQPNAWMQSLSRRGHLTSKAVQEVEAFFKNLVEVTDNGMKAHIEATYGLANIW
ncbi:MAG: HEPN domain-containing protein [Candidatus Poribacteria bacterium]|nr:HEPN domain-containing protein [Candidatus Poribacteria bacterium]